MNTATSQRTPPRPIKGSWEDLLAQAEQRARNYNDEAIPLYERVFNGLLALPAAARAAGERRLYNLMMVTGVQLQGYLNMRDRYEDSLAIIDKMFGVVEEADKPQIVELKSNVLMQAERGAEAIALLRSQAAADDADAGDWGKFVAALIRIKQPEQALPVVDEMNNWIEEQVAAGRLQGAEEREARRYQVRLHAAALLELGRITEAGRLFEQLVAVEGASGFSAHLIYTRLVQEGQYEEALRYIDRDQARPIRAAFWRGLVNRYLGAPAKATRIWEATNKEDIVRNDQESMVEHILTLFYLGDPKGEAMEIMLRTQREQNRISWMVFLLTGLGWIVRGDFPAAHTNIKLAVAQVKAMGEGKTLPHHYWRFAQDLAPAGEAEQFAQYFDTRSSQSDNTHEGVQDSAQTTSAEESIPSSVDIPPSDDSLSLPVPPASASSGAGE